ncbi:hypothetical protein M0813_01284 [Anaeramoeba flamelloides]|uniref:Uncharacterized protein n=1 Tax=Anaeramoeba flamelloides TaxID=1746091 RepID=A0AAV7YV95_9EUKA|nr:hypothetical protein M0812_20769 [Anaeramoeba flamelloides]KAJ6253238.1 hypothetical protein M0813_01284 [Anaeramoeba flamelloides]
MIPFYSKTLIKRQTSSMVSRESDEHCTSILRELVKNDYDVTVENADDEKSIDAKSKILHVTTIYGSDLWIYEKEGRMPKPGEIIDRIEAKQRKND